MLRPIWLLSSSMCMREGALGGPADAGGVESPQPLMPPALCTVLIHPNLTSSNHSAPSLCEGPPNSTGASTRPRQLSGPLARVNKASYKTNTGVARSNPNLLVHAGKAQEFVTQIVVKWMRSRAPLNVSPQKPIKFEGKKGPSSHGGRDDECGSDVTAGTGRPVRPRGAPQLNVPSLL